MNEHSIPTGTYVARAVPADYQLGYSSSNNEQVAIGLELLNEGYEGRKVTYFGSFANEKAIEITMRALRTCGWSSDNVTDPTGIDANEVEVVIEYEIWDGKERMKVKWINARGGGRFEMKKKIEGAGLTSFAARMKGAAMASRGGGGTAPAKATPPPRFTAPAGAPATPRGDAYEGGGDDLPY